MTFYFFIFVHQTVRVHIMCVYRYVYTVCGGTIILFYFFFISFILKKCEIRFLRSQYFSATDEHFAHLTLDTTLSRSVVKPHPPPSPKINPGCANALNYENNLRTRRRFHLSTSDFFFLLISGDSFLIRRSVGRKYVSFIVSSLANDRTALVAPYYLDGPIRFFSNIYIYKSKDILCYLVPTFPFNLFVLNVRQSNTEVAPFVH